MLMQETCGSHWKVGKMFAPTYAVVLVEKHEEKMAYSQQQQGRDIHNA